MAHLFPTFSAPPFVADSGVPTLPGATGAKDERSAMASESKEIEHDHNESLPDATTTEVLDGGVKRGLKNRHAQMIALGGAIGTGLFVSTGATLALGGPAFILSSFIFVSILMYFIVTALVEIATSAPIHGPSMSFYATRMTSRSLGFAMGWLYFYSLGILVPYEITAGALVIDYWNR
jgi:amino acid transporter